MVWQVSQKVKVPIIGLGGISGWEDALEFIMAGATAVAVGTGQLADPMCIPKVIDGLEAYCRAEGLMNIRGAAGSALPGRIGAK
jgi:dihydroorotate dehydrogenase (NAD+) catalytic subunit